MPDTDKHLLRPIARAEGRAALSALQMPVQGEDLWNCYDFTWLNEAGQPRVALLQISYPASSEWLIESKSLKLYLGSFAQRRIGSGQPVLDCIQNDLSNVLDTVVEICATPLDSLQTSAQPAAAKVCLDRLVISDPVFAPRSGLLRQALQGSVVEETVYSDCLRSLCPLTAQPDIGSVFIYYRGRPIEHASILHYIVSLRDHGGFHEHCCELMLNEFLTHVELESLAIACRYNRRGGIDINPRRYVGQAQDKLRYVRELRQ